MWYDDHGEKGAANDFVLIELYDERGWLYYNAGWLGGGNVQDR